MSRVVNLSYDPETLGEAVMNQYLAAGEEINKQIEELGFKTDEERAWFQRMSFAIVLRHDEGAPSTIFSVPPL